MSQKLRIVKSAIFEVEKPFEMGPDLQKLGKGNKTKNSQISLLLREKNS